MQRVVLLLAFVFALVAATSARADSRGDGVVFVQTNEPNGNQVVVYDRAVDGTLAEAGRYPTGGNGGVAAPGTEPDHLASQSSLVYDSGHALLLAVNAGSDSVSVFAVDGDRLTLAQVVPSGGAFPTSLAVSGNLAYVLDAGGTGTLQGFRIAGGKLHPINNSTRTLGLANSDIPNFLSSPGQVGFSPDGKQLIVTTKASTSQIDVFSVGADGRLSASPTANASATPVPFAFTFQPQTGRLVSGEAGASTVTTYALGANGTLSDPRSQGDGQTALCWITRVGDFYYVSNTGSSTVSAYAVGADGTPSLIGVVATTAAGTIDSAAVGGDLYVQTGIAGTIEELRVGTDGSLTSIGTVTGLPTGQEGIAAS